jgi:hypothetical protein
MIDELTARPFRSRSSAAQRKPPRSHLRRAWASHCIVREQQGYRDRPAMRRPGPSEDLRADVPTGRLLGWAQQPYSKCR